MADPESNDLHVEIAEVTIPSVATPVRVVRVVAGSGVTFDLAPGMAKLFGMMLIESAAVAIERDGSSRAIVAAPSGLIV